MLGDGREGKARVGNRGEGRGEGRKKRRGRGEELFY